MHGRLVLGFDDDAERVTVPDEPAHPLENTLGQTAISEEETGPTPSTARRQPLSAVAIIAFACFFGLGSGVVLSFGAIAGMGWLSFNTSSPEEKEPETPILAAGPELQPNMTFSFAAIEQPESSALFVYTNVDTLIPGQFPPVYLYSPLPTDKMIAPVKSRGPRLVSAGVEFEQVSQNDFQPNDFSAVFENPQYLSVIPEPPSANNASRDEVFVLPETSNVNPMVTVASLSPPLLDHGKNLIFVSKDEARSAQPVLASAPVLHKGEPGDVPQVFSQRPLKLSVFDKGLPQFTVASLADDDVLSIISSIAPPPQRRFSTSIPSVGETTFEVPRLPQVGRAHEQSRSLASKLGFDPETASRIKLVTFAPTSIKEDSIESNKEILDATGFSASTVNRVNYRVSQTHVRYYRSQDKDAALAVASEVGGIARDFTGVRNPPPGGRIEVYLEGRGKGASRTAGTKQRFTAAQRRANQKARLERSIVGSLRRGEQFGSSQ